MTCSWYNTPFLRRTFFFVLFLEHVANVSSKLAKLFSVHPSKVRAERQWHVVNSIHNLPPRGTQVMFNRLQFIRGVHSWGVLYGHETFSLGRAYQGSVFLSLELNIFK